MEPLRDSREVSGVGGELGGSLRSQQKLNNSVVKIKKTGRDITEKVERIADKMSAIVQSFLDILQPGRK